MAETKSVTIEARKDMEVSVKDLLSSCNTVREKKVDTLTTKAAAPKGRGQELCYDEHAGSNRNFDIS